MYPLLIASRMANCIAHFVKRVHSKHQNSKVHAVVSTKSLYLDFSEVLN